MSLANHIAELRRRHGTLSDAVDEAHRLPSFCSAELAQLKKNKLQLKEKILRGEAKLRQQEADCLSLAESALADSSDAPVLDLVVGSCCLAEEVPPIAVAAE